MKIKQTAKSFWLVVAGALIVIPGTLVLFLLEYALSFCSSSFTPTHSSKPGFFTL